MKVWNWKQLLKIGKTKFNQIVKEKIQPLHPVTFIRHVLDWKIKQDQKKENHITAIYYIACLKFKYATERKAWNDKRKQMKLGTK